MTLFILVIMLVSASLTACDDLFQYSPYDSNISQYNLNEKNIGKIKLVGPADTLWFVAISDIHHGYDDLSYATKKINSLQNISFVVVCGDITDAGLAKEFEWYHQEMENLNVQYITVIGNHDYRSSGSDIYKKMFGPVNFKFEVGPYHFIGFDDVVWEDKNSLPDFEWLNYNLIDTISTVEVVFSHIPPWDEQIGIDTAELKTLITKRPDQVLSIHGHLHNYSYRIMNAYYIVTGAINDKELLLIGLHDTTYTIQRKSF